MKKLYSGILLLMIAIISGQISYTITPNPFNETDAVTLTIPGSQIDESAWEFQTMRFIFGHGL